MRDIRPFTVRLSEALRSSASGFVLGMVACVTYVEPALVDVAVPGSVLYALWVLTRRVSLPLRLPASSGLLDYGDPQPGSRKPKRAGGSWFVGWDLAGREAWITPEDARQHMTIPGTTGAGKTTAILSLLVNSLAQGSGFVIVDGKADRHLFSKVLAMARRFGREDDVRVLNFMVASDIRDSHTFNAFASGNAVAVKEMLLSQLGEQQQHDSNGVFRDKASALIGSIAPVLVWLRDHRGIPLTIDVIRFSVVLPWIWNLAMKGVAQVRDIETGDLTDLDVGEQIPEDLTWALKAYLGELPGYDSSLPLEKQKSDDPSKQHGYALMYFTAVFARLTVDLGHIFRCESGDIEMRDVVLNRRILVVNLPALEGSDSSLAALGKLVVASVRGMMAQLLGVSLEGDYTEFYKPGMGPSPYSVVLDEMAYYATGDLARMLAMGRGINISFMLAFQEVSGVWAQLGEKTASLLGNANLTLAMRQQDAGRTREWLEKTAGQTSVTQATAYHGAADGNYREARQADIRTVCKVDWNDLTSLIEGEAIILMGSRRVYAKLFHAKIDDDGTKRYGRTVTVKSPDAAAIRAREARLDAIAGRVEQGQLAAGHPVEMSAAMTALLTGFSTSARFGGSARDCARAAIAAVAELPEGVFDDRPPSPADGTPTTAVTPMLYVATRTIFAGVASASPPHEPIDDRMLRGIEAVERAAGVPRSSSYGAALSILAERDDALEELVRVEPPPMSAEVFAQHLASVIRQVEAIVAAPAAKSVVSRTVAPAIRRVA